MGESGIPRRAIADGVVSPNKLDFDANQRYFHIKGNNYRPITMRDTGYALPLGTDETGAIVNFGHGNPPVALIYKPGDASILGPRASASDRLLLSLDQTASEGAIYIWGKNTLGVGVNADGVDSGFEHVVGTSGACFIRAKLVASTVGNLAELCVGFMKAQDLSGETLPDGFEDAAFLNCIAGDHYIETILNDAATDSVDTGQDATNLVEFEYEVILDPASRGGSKVRFFIDGTEFYPGTAFQFDEGDSVFPFILYLMGGGPTPILTSEIEVGRLIDVNDHFLL